MRHRTLPAARLDRPDRLALCLAALAALARPAAAAAPAEVPGQARSVVVLDPAPDPALAEAVAAALSEGQLRVVDPGQLQALLRAEPALRGCRTPACLLRLGEALSAHLVLQLSLTCARQEGAACATYRLRAQLFNATVGGADEWRGAECAPAGVAAAAREVLKDAVLKEQARYRGAIAARTNLPPDQPAQVAVDGLRRGQTPYERPVYAGPHRVRLVRQGYLPYQRSVNVERGQTVLVDALLEPAEERYRPLWRFLVGGAVAAAGVVLVGLGGRALAVDGRCTGDLSLDPAAHRSDGRCPLVYDSLRVGAPLTAVGTAMVAGSLGFFLWPPARRPLRVSVEETP